MSKPNSGIKPVNHILIYVLIRSWRSFIYFDRCIDSVFNQSYKNFKILFVDDASDLTKIQKEYIKQKLKGHIYIFNKEREFAVYNGYKMIHNYANGKDSIVVNLDADDWLINNNFLSGLAKIYNKNDSPYLTYGGCLIWNGKNLVKRSKEFDYRLSNTRYPKNIEKRNSYRKVPFRVFHPMTFRTELFKKIKENDFKEDNDSWLKFCPDLASFIPMLEMANGRYKVLKNYFYAYNIENSESNLKKNLYYFIREPLIIRKKKTYGRIE